MNWKDVFELLKKSSIAAALVVGYGLCYFSLINEHSMLRESYQIVAAKDKEINSITSKYQELQKKITLDSLNQKINLLSNDLATQKAIIKRNNSISKANQVDSKQLDSLINYMMVDAALVDLNDPIEYTYSAYSFNENFDKDSIDLNLKIKKNAWLKANMLIKKLGKTQEYQQIMDEIYKPRDFKRNPENNIKTTSL